MVADDAEFEQAIAEFLCTMHNRVDEIGEEMRQFHNEISMENQDMFILTSKKCKTLQNLNTSKRSIDQLISNFSSRYNHTTGEMEYDTIAKPINGKIVEKNAVLQQDFQATKKARVKTL